MRRRITWLLFAATFCAGTGVATYKFRYAADRRAFLPGPTTHGHYQIELRCDACHTPLMGVKTDACNQCHGAEMAAINDSHPRTKFTDPRNADLLAKINAAECVTCHREHRPEQTHAMGLTQPDDYCFHCHRDVAKERPSHTGMSFKTCATAGCHNFHDNTALYEDFVAKHAHEPELRIPTQRLVRPPAMPPAGHAALAGAQRNAPAAMPVDQQIIYDWEQSAHARAAVNCSDCHQDGDAAKPWVAQPALAACQRCHDGEAKGFLESRHGMRLAAGLPPMTPGEARQPMRADAAHRTMTCNACHESHRYDPRTAAVDACLKCHDDAHSRAYPGSAHQRTWLAELSGAAPAGTGVSCATCHLPRETHRADGRDVVAVQHNQNANLRPNEKMIRTVCLDCHGFPFALDALADRALVEANFRGRPARHLDTVEMVLRRAAAHASSQPPTENKP